MRQHNAQPILLQIMKIFFLKVHSYHSHVIFNVKYGQYIGYIKSNINDAIAMLHRTNTAMKAAIAEMQHKHPVCQGLETVLALFKNIPLPTSYGLFLLIVNKKGVKGNVKVSMRPNYFIFI